MNQYRLLMIIDEYEKTNRKIIKTNLKRMMKEKNFKLRDIEELGYNRHNTASWTNKASQNAPLFQQALRIACNFDFDVEEFTKAV